ncbi:cytochrome P450 [Annulohypoxylon maeteangense]|uniref:cytochrome P450 n=1 Tax=Annulohypoxylon maeteangense TaxID=1927788 RepID=UPI00200867A7|nr:cytochrome P450 [Annulohypoxylon maeteangense]KAI0886466.1 cytochrome P450 [Annulohypoxylon maeteangense]
MSGVSESRLITLVFVAATERPWVVLNSIILATLLAVYLVHRSENARRLNAPGIPLVRGPRFGDFRQVMKEANLKYSGQPYMTAFFDPTVVIPFHCVEELKNSPDAQISATGNMETRFSTKLVGSGDLSKELAASVKYDLPRGVGDFFSALQEETKLSGDQVLPHSDTWTRIEVQQDLVQIVGRVIGRFIVGAPLNRDKTWLKASIDHAIAVIMFSFWLRQFPKFLRPYIAPFMPYKRMLDDSKRVIEASVRPLIQQKLTGSAETSEPLESGRLVQWLLQRHNYAENPEYVTSQIVKDHNTLCFAAIHGPNVLLVHALIDLASYPQYVIPLREEIDRELAQAPFEEWTQETVERLEFMDAFCKESSRMNPQSVIAWFRKTHQPITLSTGHIIPAETLVASMNPLFTPSAFPEIEDAGKFYPERWMKDRSNPHPDASFRFGSATLDSMTFGFGKHSCPGRALGTTMVKDVLAYIVSKWDVRLGGGRVGRPENVYMDFQTMPPVLPLGDVYLEVKARGS